MKKCPCSKYVTVYSPGLYNIQNKKKNKKKPLKNKLKIETDLSRYPAAKQPLISTLSLNLRWCKKRDIICRPVLYNVEIRKKSKKVHNSWN